MRGNVLGFDPATGSGAISGHDGLRYDFTGADWRDQRRPRSGDLVDFAPEGQRATRVYLLEPEYIQPSFGAFFFSPAGRISRSQYWLRAMLPIWAVFFVGSFAAMVAGGAGAHGVAAVLSLLLFLYSLAIVWPLFAVNVKRIHDRNKSGWLILIPLIPAVLIVITFIIGVTAAVTTALTVGAVGFGTLLGAGAFSIVLYIVQFVISVWFFIEFGCLRGTIGANRFGPDPVR